MSNSSPVLSRRSLGEGGRGDRTQPWVERSETHGKGINLITAP